jgi:uncharacterized membrane protein YoaK (UPF0700 family)
MPPASSRQSASDVHTAQASIAIAGLLAFIAGGVNVVGFLATEWFASHLSGAVTGASAAVLTHNSRLAIGYFAVIHCFVAGAAWAAMLVAWNRLPGTRSPYAPVLLFEGLILLAIGFTADLAAAHEVMFVPLLILALSFLMGMQNALISRLASAGIRTTHVTGMLTDLGVELGKMMRGNAAPQPCPHGDDSARFGPSKLKTLALMAVLFFAGGAAGTAAFQQAGCLALLPLAAMLILLAWMPA